MEVINCPCYKDEFTCRENSLIMQSCKDNENCFIKKFLKIVKEKLETAKSYDGVSYMAATRNNFEWILEYFGVEEND